MTFISKFAAAQDGVTLIEYGLLAALISIAAIAAITAVGVQVNAIFARVRNVLVNAQIP
jgi:pilus assembly protein Flp/PilA